MSLEHAHLILGKPIFYSVNSQP